MVDENNEENLKPEPHPDDARDLPEVRKKDIAQGEETPGQPEAVEKNRIEVPEVSHAGQKLEADQRADEERKQAEEEAEAKKRAEAEAADQDTTPPGEVPAE